MNPGIYKDLSYPEYHKIDAINHSILKCFGKSAAHAEAELTVPREQTKAMLVGQAVHAAVLEPETYAEGFTAAPKVDRRTTVGKAKWAAFLAENKGKEILTDDEFMMTSRVSEAVWKHPLAIALLSGQGMNEASVVWERDGYLCKSRCDRITTFDGWTVVADVKTCEDASPSGFARAAAKFRYHSQAAWYLDGLNRLDPRDRRFFFIAVEKKEPFCVAVYELGETSFVQGCNDCDKFFSQYKTCVETQEWPGYGDDLITLELPKWAVRPEEWETHE